jgi:hypothetical protein
MTIDSSSFQRLLDDFQLGRLFVNLLGWEKPTMRSQQVPLDGHTFTLTQIAHKRGVSVFQCTPDANGAIPPRATLLKLEKEAAKLAYEHLLIFSDAQQSALTWLWVSRLPGQPVATRTHTWRRGASGEPLRQKLEQIVWSLEEEEAVTLTDVIVGLRRAFDRDRVSRAFYDRFKSEHQAFADFISGISAVADQAWYASLMLNRLMFVYFIQRKGFLDQNPNYLSDRLAKVRQSAGKGKFHSFYRQFLRRLFHEGLGTPPRERDTTVASLVGDVPYLNGGLFALHQLEEAYPSIDVPDEAFERLFAFFDDYDWHLDDRPLATGNEINADVLGYIFEKYINQKQMGAYYTKEDITEYISKNTVIPQLIEQARERCKVAFEGEASVWNLLKADPERYIYPAMKTGVIDGEGQVVPESALPDFVQAGMKDPKARMFERRYNLGEAVFHTGTGHRGTLPTETWREYVDRRTRCLHLRDKLAKGEVKRADDLITLNLDIRQFMQDVIDTATSPDLLRAVWQTIVGRVPEKASEKFRHGVTILDPTCGSGAFLFAALNILEPLYEACLDRMEGFVEDARKLGKTGEVDFAKVLAEVEKHPSRRYYIFKSIILHNLFGVDIMAEAVEICKLRLFLKLVSQVDAVQELEPLPDIDFNIRAGNTLVGYATEAQFDAANTLASDQNHRDEIKASTADLADLFDRFREQQTVHGGKVTPEDKRKLREKLNALSLELDRYLARDYGIDPDKAKAFAVWRESHQPFHWFAEFYGVMREGGFDVVIGNPPYVSTRKIDYSITRSFQCHDCNDIFAVCTERSYSVMNDKALVGLIVPLSATSTDAMLPLKQYLKDNSQNAWLSYYSASDQPASLFTGVRHRLMILLARKGNGLSSLQTTRFLKWFSQERDALFSSKLSYVSTINGLSDPFCKVSSELELNLLTKLFKSRSIANVISKSGSPIYYHNAPVHWGKVFDFIPHFRVGKSKPVQSSHVKTLFLKEKRSATVTLCILNSSLFYWFNWQYSNCRDLSLRDILRFPADAERVSDAVFSSLRDNGQALMIDLSENKKLYSRITNNVRTEFDSFYPAKSKPIIDKLDMALGKHYAFTKEETDFIINYDIKYRFGVSGEEE